MTANYHTALTGTPTANIATFNTPLSALDTQITANAAAIAENDPLTTKGDVFTYSTVQARLGVGSNGEVLTADSAEATGLKWGPGPGQVAILWDQKTSATDGGNASATTWNVRDLNTEHSDVYGLVTIGSNLFTPIAGTYLIEASAPAFDVGLHRLKLYNASGLSDVFFGQVAEANTGGNVTSPATLTGVFTTAGSVAYGIRHYTTSAKTGGLGQAVGDGGVEVYTVVKLTKIG